MSKIMRGDAIAALVCTLIAGCVDRSVCLQPPSSPVAETQEDGPADPDLYVGSGDPYGIGELEIRRIPIEPCEAGAPVRLNIYTPVGAARYPVVLFEHGFTVDIDWYTESLNHLASHGFVVLAPQTYAPFNPFAAPSDAVEADRVLQVLDWAQGSLDAVTGVATDMSRLGISGHSRGGKVAWKVVQRDPSRFLAIAGVDPVDSDFGGRVTSAGLTFSVPSLVIGTALGVVPAPGIPLACAPAGFNHVQFYEVVQAPAWHVVALDGGHMDMLDSGKLGNCGVVCMVCTSGPNPAATRQMIVGMMVAMFRGTLQGDTPALDYLVNTSLAPSRISVESK